MSSGPQASDPRIDTSVAHSARIWNYWLGGKDYYPVDQEIGDQMLTFVPELVRSARADRYFLARGVRYVVAKGIRQFLDIGRQAARTLDFGQPVAIMMLGVLNFVVDDAQAIEVVRHLVDGVVPGSYLVISHPTAEIDAGPATESVRIWNENGSASMTLRSREELLP